MTPFVRSWNYTAINTIAKGIPKVGYYPYTYIEVYEKYHLDVALPYPCGLVLSEVVSFGTAVNSGNEWDDTLIDHNNIEYII